MKLKSISSNDPRPADDRRSRRTLTLEMCFSRQLCALLGLPIEMYGIFMQILRRLPAEAASFHLDRSKFASNVGLPLFYLANICSIVYKYIYIHSGNLNIEQVLLFELDSCCKKRVNLFSLGEDGTREGG